MTLCACVCVCEGGGGGERDVFNIHLTLNEIILYRGIILFYFFEDFE